MGGAYYGWNVFEGSQPYAASTPPDNMVYPIAEYSHQEGGCSVTGGYVYRGEAVPELEGVYLFGDYCSGRIWATYRDQSEAWQYGDTRFDQFVRRGRIGRSLRGRIS
jgi:hypothetical protein